MRSTRFVLATLFAMVCPLGLLAEPVGSLSGAVVTPDGARLPGVTLYLRHLPSAAEVRLATGTDGLFRVGRLAAGSWQLRAELPDGTVLVDRQVVIAADTEQTVELEAALPLFAETASTTATFVADSLEAPRLRESAARDVGEALEALPGVSKLRKGDLAAEVVVRGFQSRDLNVLIDGQRIHGACPNKMDPAAFHVDFAEVDRVEVARGPVDVRHQGSLAGLVNVVTRRPETGRHLRPELAVGTRGYRSAALAGSWGGEHVAGLVGGSWRQADPYQDGAGRASTAVANYRPGVADEDAFEVGTGWAKLSATIAPGRTVELAATGQRADAMVYPYLMMDAVRDDADRVLARYQADGLGGHNLVLAGRLTWARVRHDMDDALRLSSLGRPRTYSMLTEAETETLGAAVEVEGERWAFGLDAYRRGWDATNRMAMTGYRPLAMIPDAVVEVGGLFAERTQRLGERATLVAGLRLDAAHSEADRGLAQTALYERYHGGFDLTATDLLPAGKVRLVMRYGRLQATVGLGHAARLPEPNERYLAIMRMGNDWVGDPDLAPSRNTGLDGELAYERSGRRIALALYAQRVADFIAVAPVAPRQATGMPRSARSWANVDATVAGAELSGSAVVGQRVFLSGDLSWVWGERDAVGTLPSAPLAEVPPLALRVAGRYDDGRFFVELEEVAAARQSRIDPALAETETPGWAVTNLRAGLRWRALTASVALRNAFDRDYVEHLSFQRDPFRSGVRLHEPGRTLQLDLGYRF